jgi:hypothetical protein
LQDTGSFHATLKPADEYWAAPLRERVLWRKNQLVSGGCTQPKQARKEKRPTGLRGYLHPSESARAN